jgi:hypothetical protein
MNVETWKLTFKAAPDENGVPMPVRVRRLLKAALRSYRLRCVDIEVFGVGDSGVQIGTTFAMAASPKPDEIDDRSFNSGQGDETSRNIGFRETYYPQNPG